MSVSSGTLKLVAMLLLFGLLAWGTYWYFNYKIKTIEYSMEHPAKI